MVNFGIGGFLTWGNGKPVAGSSFTPKKSTPVKRPDWIQCSRFEMAEGVMS